MNDSIEVRKVIAVLRRWWWLLVAVAIVGAAGKLQTSQWQTPVYAATTTLLVGQSMQATQLDSRDIAASEQLALTYAQVVRLQPVLQAVVEKLNLGVSWQTLAARVHGTPVEQTQLLKITAEAESPEVARLFADEVAATLISLLPTAKPNVIQAASEPFIRHNSRHSAPTSQKVSDGSTCCRSSILRTRTTDQLRAIQSEIDDMQSLVVGWESNYSKLLDVATTQGAPTYLTVVEPAQAAADPVRPRPLVNVLMVSLVSLVLALGVVIFLDFSDETVKSTTDLGASVGSTFGRYRTRSDAERRYADYADQSLIPVSEAYTMVRNNIQFTAGSRQLTSILVTDLAQGRGEERHGCEPGDRHGSGWLPQSWWTPTGAADVASNLRCRDGHLGFA